jgi:hypothetical protein
VNWVRKNCSFIFGNLQLKFSFTFNIELAWLHSILNAVNKVTLHSIFNAVNKVTLHSIFNAVNKVTLHSIFNAVNKVTTFNIAVNKVTCALQTATRWLISVYLCIQIYCSLRKGNQNTFAFALKYIFKKISVISSLLSFKCIYCIVIYLPAHYRTTYIVILSIFYCLISCELYWAQLVACAAQLVGCATQLVACAAQLVACQYNLYCSLQYTDIHSIYLYFIVCI